uniref:Dolichyl-diphosphooligosaccharide--protein glycosyltransferase 48 kDa subunit n=1 Tax=Ascaris lumbricoides TaxID=6252 RepID=A0A0M3HIC6_ASCLU
TISINEEGKLVKSYIYGDYWRLINPGTYHVKYDHILYEPLTITITITNQSPNAFKNVVLRRRANQHSFYRLHEISASISCTSVFSTFIFLLLIPFLLMLNFFLLTFYYSYYCCI